MGVEGDEDEDAAVAEDDDIPDEGDEGDEDGDNDDDDAEGYDYDDMEIEDEGSDVDEMDEATAMKAMLDESSSEEGSEDEEAGVAGKGHKGLFASAEEFAHLLNEDNEVNFRNGSIWRYFVVAAFGHCPAHTFSVCLQGRKTHGKASQDTVEHVSRT